MTDKAEGSLLYLDDVSVSFDGFKAINRLSLVLEPGEMRAIIGPNAMVPENAQIGGNEPIALFMEKARTARKGART